MRRLVKVVGLLAAVGALAVGMAACGDGDSGSADGGTANAEAEGGGEVAIDVGSETIEVAEGTAPKIAMFAASGALYQEAQRKAVESRASELGFDLTFFDSKFEPTEQLNQLQNALTAGEYDAWIFESYAGPAPCPQVSKKAPSAGIVVVQVTVPTCQEVEGAAAGEESWAPGTLSTVAGATTSTYYNSFAEEVARLAKASNPKVAILNGPPAVTTTTLLKEGVEKAGLEIVEEVNSDYTTPDGLAKTQTMLQANPDIDVIVSVYSDSTIGAIRAIEAAGKSDEIEVFDLGGSSQTVQAIEEGKQTMSAPYYPVSVGEAAVQALADAFAGKPVDRFYAGFAQGTPEEPFFITKDTAKEFKAQY